MVKAKVRPEPILAKVPVAPRINRVRLIKMVPRHLPQDPVVPRVNQANLEPILAKARLALRTNPLQSPEVLEVRALLALKRIPEQRALLAHKRTPEQRALQARRRPTPPLRALQARKRPIPPLRAVTHKLSPRVEEPPPQKEAVQARMVLRVPDLRRVQRRRVPAGTLPPKAIQTATTSPQANQLPNRSHQDKNQLAQRSQQHRNHSKSRPRIRVLQLLRRSLKRSRTLSLQRLPRRRLQQRLRNLQLRQKLLRRRRRHQLLRLNLRLRRRVREVLF